MPIDVRDKYIRYYTEKIWEMIPAVYRHEDGLGENPGVLRGMVEVLAEQAAHLRRSTDRLWEDQSIESCDDWAVPYIADLVATRLVSALNKRGRRVDTAKTIYYRRRKGTPRILEELISDIAGWEGAVVEQFRRLGRSRHSLDAKPKHEKGKVTGSLPGGLADIRNARCSKLIDGPFDEFHHTPDVRRHKGSLGRYGISKVAFYLYRLKVYRLEGVTPRARTTGSGYTLDPSGRDIQLYMPRNRSHHLPEGSAHEQNWERWQQAREGELPAPLYCRLLDYLHDELIPSAVDVQDSGASFLPQEIVAADLGAWPSLTVAGKRAAVDPCRGRLQYIGTTTPASPSTTHHIAFSAPLGVGTYPRTQVEARTPLFEHSGGSAILPAQLANNDVTQINDNATYPGLPNKNNVQNLILQAANAKRPYIRLGANWVLRTLPTATEDGNITLDGLWLGADGGHSLILRGDYQKVTLAHCTLDPGGIDADGGTIHSVPLVIEAHVEELVVEKSILATIRTQNDGAVEKLVIRDSILQAPTPADSAIDLIHSEVILNRVTILGTIDCNRLRASEALITGNTDVQNTQDGCFRYGAAPAGSRLPHPYESYEVHPGEPLFVSQRFGDAAYCQLVCKASEKIRRGAENGSEMGAFSSLLNPIKLDSLHKKTEEYLPFGLVPLYILET